MPRMTMLCLAAIGIASAAHAQDEPAAPAPAPVIPAPEPTRSFRLLGGGQYWAETDYNVTRLYSGLTIVDRLDRSTRLMTSLRLGWDKYHFDDGSTITPDRSEPWDLIFTGAAVVGLDVQLDNDLGTNFGGIVIASVQDGAEVEDGIRAGGYADIRYQVTPDLLLGAGITIVDRLEHRVKTTPRLIIDWRLSDDVRLTSLSYAIPNMQGVELLWTMGDGWETAVGAGYAYEEFRLDDSDLAPDGVGIEEAIPLWYRLSKSDKRGTITGYIGLGTGIEVRLDDDNGNNIGKLDGSMAIIWGIQASLHF